MTIKEVRLLSSTNLRSLCIRNGWYTRGDNDEYSNLLFNMTHDGNDNISTEDVYLIAKNIMEHSEPEIFKFCDIASVMFEIAAACNTIFVMEEN